MAVASTIQRYLDKNREIGVARHHVRDREILSGPRKLGLRREIVHVGGYLDSVAVGIASVVEVRDREREEDVIHEVHDGVACRNVRLVRMGM